MRGKDCAQSSGESEMKKKKDDAQNKSAVNETLEIDYSDEVAAGGKSCSGGIRMAVCGGGDGRSGRARDADEKRRRQANGKCSVRRRTRRLDLRLVPTMKLGS